MIIRLRHALAQVWDFLSGELGLRNGIFRVWMKFSGYADWCWSHLTSSRMQRALPGTRIEAGRSFIDCSGR